MICDVCVCLRCLLCHTGEPEVRGFSSRTPYFHRSAPFIRCRCCVMQQTQKGPNGENRAWTSQWRQSPRSSEVTRTNFYKMHVFFFSRLLGLFHNIVASLVASLLLPRCLLIKENLFHVSAFFFNVLSWNTDVSHFLLKYIYFFFFKSRVNIFTRLLYHTLAISIDTATIKQMKENLSWSQRSLFLLILVFIFASGPCLCSSDAFVEVCQRTGCSLHLCFLPDAGFGALTRQPWKRKCKRSLMHHPLTSCSLFEACQPISGQDHRKSPSAGIAATVAEADVFSGAEEVWWGEVGNQEDKRAKSREKRRAGLRLTAAGPEHLLGAGPPGLAAPPCLVFRLATLRWKREVLLVYFLLIVLFSSIIEHQHITWCFCIYLSWTLCVYFSFIT